MSWKEKRLITILSIILAVLCAAVLVVLSIRYRAAQAAKDQNTVSPSDIAEAARSEYVALSYSNGSTTLSFSLNEDGVWTWDSEPDFPLDDTHVKSILTILETLKPQQTLDMPEDLSVYGLDAPDVSLTATAPDDAVLTVTSVSYTHLCVSAALLGFLEEAADLGGTAEIGHLYPDALLLPHGTVEFLHQQIHRRAGLLAVNVPEVQRHRVALPKQGLLSAAGEGKHKGGYQQQGK